MSKQTEQALLAWESEGRDPCDDLHHHFTEWGRWDWCEIADETLRVYNLMLEDEAENGSLVDGFFSAAAAQASHGAFAAVATALGVEARHLELALAEWYENQDAPPPPVTPAEFMRKIQEAKQWCIDLDAVELDVDGSTIPERRDVDD